MYRKPLTMHATFGRSEKTEMTTRLETAIARVIAEGKVRTYENMSGPPRRHGLAVARAAKIPHSTWPKPSPSTPARKLRSASQGDNKTRYPRLRHLEIGRASCRES